VLVAIVMLGGGALVAWNVFGQGPYGDSCHHSIGCRSFYCVKHSLQGSAQVSSSGFCTKKCASDSDCGSAARCVVLSEDSRDDLPPYGKPDRACLQVRELPR
jgi:hypothetical protein